MAEVFPTNAVTTTSGRADLAKGVTYAAMVLDRSVSMAGPSAIQLLEGAADFLEEMREVATPVKVSFDLFAERSQRGTFALAATTDYLTQTRYAATGRGTAIYDAIHDAVAHVEAEKRAQDRAIVSIFTDGGENSSKVHTVHDTQALVLRKRAEGWIFLFAGPHKTFPASIGIDPAHQFALRGGDIRGVLAEVTRSVVQALLPAKGGTICL
jgi:hypothetical protein